MTAAFQRLAEKGGNYERDCYVVDCGSSLNFLAFRRGECPCLLRSRSSPQSYWVSSLGRYLTTEDRMKLQGYECSPNRPCDAAMNKMLGNAMSVNVVQAVLLQAAWALGFGGR